MGFTVVTLLIATGLFVGILLCFEAGRRTAIRRLRGADQSAPPGFSTIESAIFSFLSLLVAFTFFGAGARFDERRRLIVDEANKIGTAFLRVDLLPGEAQSAMRKSFRDYVDARLAFYQQPRVWPAAPEKPMAAKQLQEAIWRQAVLASRAEGAHPDAGRLLLPALNEMIDITTTRMMALQMHPPVIVFIMLFGMALISALVAGYCAAPVKSPHWLHAVSFALVMAFSVYVILDLEYPRLGLIRVDVFDQVLVELRQSMN